MKLQLTSEKGVVILAVSESIAHHEAQVLRAGLTKLFKAGKNKIVLEMPMNQDLPAEVIRELAAFDLLARELSGRIVLARVSPALKTKIAAFSTPPVVVCFDTRLQAINFLIAPPKPEIMPGAPAAATVTEPNEADRLREQESSLKGRLSDLEKENRSLREQLVAAVIARRPPADEAAYGERIQYLETKIDKLIAEAAAAPAAGGGGGSGAAAKKG